MIIVSVSIFTTHRSGMSPRKPIERKNEEPKNPTLVALVQHSSDNPRKLSFAKGDLIEVIMIARLLLHQLQNCTS
jgi:hypothetical protein